MDRKGVGFMRRCELCLLPETHETLVLNSDNICNICNDQKGKWEIDWPARLKALDELILKYKGKYKYDFIVPFSGGKDSTWTLYYLKKRFPDVRPLVVRFNHGFLRKTVKENSDRVFRKLGVDVHEFTPSWSLTKRVMLEAFIEKGDFCWHCHSGIFAYPMQVAIKENTPLIFWGEPSSEYTAYYSYNQKEEVDEERFNRFVNLGITADDMYLRLGGSVDERELGPFRYPKLSELRELGYRSVCLGSYIPWDVKKQVETIKRELDWEGDVVENVPQEFSYEKIECWMQGVRDYIKYIKRGYSRPSHLMAIDLRNKRATVEEAKSIVREYEGLRPASLDIFLEYLSITEEEFYEIAISHAISPWKFDKNKIRKGERTPDFLEWARGESLPREYSRKRIEEAGYMCNDCEDCTL